MSAVTNLNRQATYLFAALSVIVILGFWPSYFTRLSSTGISFHLHGFLMFLWMAALITQAILIRTGQLRWHRFVGRSSYLVAPLMVLSGFVVMRQFLGGPGAEHSASLLRDFTIPLIAIGQFVLMYGLAMYFRRRPQLHARYMISTGVILGGAGSFRIIANWMPGISSAIGIANANFLFLEVVSIGLILNDLRLGKVRAPFVVLLASLGIHHILYWTAAEMVWWQTLARWISG